MATAETERLLALDAVRGVTVAGMLLVNDPGSWGAIYPPLKHAEWHGWTATDLVFPFFLFIVGVTTHLSRRQSAPLILRRGLIIIALGLLLNWFPFFTWGTIPELPDASLWDRVVHRLQHLRFSGVLQRIGICYIIAGLLALRTSLKTLVLITASLLLGYWVLMTLGGTLDQPSQTLAARVDRAVIGENHIWRQSRTWDPEGVLSTLPAIATTLLGVFAGRWIASGRPLLERIAGLSSCGALGMMVGLMWHWIFPINKNLWTSSYVLFTAGMAALSLATCIWIIDLHGLRRWTRPFVVFGINPILAFVGSGLMARLMYSVIKVPYEGTSIPLQAAIYRSLFEPFFSPKNASLLFAIAFVLFWYVILDFFYRRKWILKV